MEYCQREDTATRVALTDGHSTIVSYAEICDVISSSQSRAGELVFLLLKQSVEATVQYLSLLASGATVFLLPPQTTLIQLVRLLNQYKPREILGDLSSFDCLDVMTNDQFERRTRNSYVYRGSGDTELIHQQQLLLSTSGSTGSPQIVRLSGPGVSANAIDIAEALRLDRDDVGITVLPLHYTYGLSVLHSHLVVGATVVCSEVSPTDRQFRSLLEACAVTNLAGVPFSYSMYERMGLVEKPPAALQAMTQAGGALSADGVRKIASRLSQNGVDFYVMYGQTEATARMSILPPDQVFERPSSVGLSVRSGRFEIGSTEDSDEVVFVGPNVMLGYAKSASDLNAGDVMEGRLSTGDLGYLEDGYLHLTGRKKRIVKIAGERYSLDEVERVLSEHVVSAVVSTGDKVRVFAEGSSLYLPQISESLRSLRIARRDYEVTWLESLPRLASGKIDYASLA